MIAAFAAAAAIRPEPRDAHARRTSVAAGTSTIVVDDGATRTPITQPGTAQRPVWSPAGTRIAFHGQNLDVTHVPAGHYWLVHRTNSDSHLREEHYGDDAASLLVRIAWPHGHDDAPAVTALRTFLKERCP